MTPQSAFITFENPLAALLAKKMKTIKRRRKLNCDKKIFDRNINIKPLGHPSDTIYENYGMS